jgi:multidrug transporter EmrE-like cation transporter
MTRYIPLIMVGVLLNAAAQLLLKAGMNRIGHFDFTPGNIWPIGWRIATNLPIVAGLSCYVISVGVWMLALSRVEVSFAYPLLSVGYIVNAIAAWYLFGEALTPMRMAGILVIMFGVFLISRG